MDQANTTKPALQTTESGTSPLLVGLAIFLFFPLGLYLLWKHPVLGRNKTWWWVGGVWSFIVFLSAVNGDKDKKPGAADVAQAAPARSPQPNGRPEPSRPVATAEHVADNESPARTSALKPKKVKKGINLENYERITDEMPREDVEAMLGEGRELASAGEEKAIVYETRNILTGSERFIEVHYLHGRVIVKFKDGF